MEPAATLQKKKTSIQKGQLKKTIKNILCRPDPISWPTVSEDEAKILDNMLQKHKVKIPYFKKPHWKKVKDLPKEQRPKPPKLEKVNGLLFGLSECSNALNKKECSGIILESTINPRIIVQSITELCVTNKIPYVCLKDLRNVCATYFGIPTSCLGLQGNSVPELEKYVSSLAKKLNSPSTVSVLKNSDSHVKVTQVKDPLDIEMIEVTKNAEVVEPSENKPQIPTCPFLYRTNNKTRVFVPIQEQTPTEPTLKFVGQDFIVFDKNPSTDKKMYKDMLVKRIGNNPNRKSGKLKRNKNK